MGSSCKQGNGKQRFADRNMQGPAYILQEKLRKIGKRNRACGLGGVHIPRECIQLQGARCKTVVDVISKCCFETFVSDNLVLWLCSGGSFAGRRIPRIETKVNIVVNKITP